MKKLILFAIVILLLLPQVGHSQSGTGSFMFGGQNRDYRFYVPPTYTGNTAVPLVFNLHGLTSDAFQQELYSGMNSVADTAGFIVCYPDGLNNSWNSGFSAPYWGGIDDVGFISVLIDTLSAQFNIDPARVFSCGMSNGGFMSFRLACELEDRIAAIASVTGTMTTLQTDNCVPTRPMPVLQIHGTLDAVVSYPGNTISLGVDSVINYWRTANACTAPVVTYNFPDISFEGSTVESFTYGGCTDGVEVIHYRVENGGHTWPGAFPIPAGITNQDIDASVEIWRFFNRWTHPNPVLVSREEAAPVQSLEIGPNPFADRVKISGIEPGSVLMVTDSKGREVYRATNVQNSELQLSTTDWASGIYYLQAGQGENARFKVLAKQN